MSSLIQEPEPADYDLPGSQNEHSDSSAADSDSSSSSSNTNSISRNTFVQQKKPATTISPILLTMLNFCKEIAIMVFIAVTYAALTNDSPPKIGKSPAAYPFFPRDSPVADWYRGEITRAIEQARLADLAFVMFYAPWDAESQTVRHEFALAAQSMHGRVTFAAVNCWQPGGECKQQYSKVYSWPVLIAYPAHGRGVQYNGELSAPHMVRFLENVARPLVRADNGGSLLLAEHDVVVVGIMNTLPGSYDYSVFYLSALRCLERDPYRDISFAIESQTTGTTQRQLLLHMWNETLFYPVDNQWEPEAILAWIFKHIHQINGWVTPSGTKSLTLSKYIQSGPALILFTPRNPFLRQIDYYSILRETANDYFNCQNDVLVRLKRTIIKSVRLVNRNNYRRLKIDCLSTNISRNLNPNNIVTRVLPTTTLWTNTSSSQHCSLLRKQTIIAESPQQLVQTCNNNNYKIKCDQFYRTSMLTGLNDRRSPQNLLRLKRIDDCERILNAERYQPALFVDNDDDDQDSSDHNITGLSCKNNFTLSLLALDSLKYYHFAEKLGVNLFDIKDRTSVIMINQKMETHHIMSGSLNGRNLRQFIYNFTHGSLVRALNPNPHVTSKHTHVFPHLTGFDTSSSIINDQKKIFCLNELTSETFLPAIMQFNKTVVVFYYSKQCAFCSGISYTFLTVAKILFDVTDVQFARIDGDLNLLPWEYTMESYPTILFVPKYRKSESRVFPRNLPINVPNLIGFVLTNLDPIVKLQAMWSICSETKFDDDKNQCTASIRAEILSVIERSLKDWRRNVSKRQKSDILYKLQLLKHLHLLFAHSPTKLGLIEKRLKKLNHFDSISHRNNYYNNNKTS